jgi:hypothetical protein
MLVGTGGKVAELKVGMGWLMTRQDPGYGYETYLDAALTGGLDVAAPIGPRSDLLMTFRYSRALRDHEAEFTGLGRDIYRVGIGVRTGKLVAVSAVESDAPPSRTALTFAGIASMQTGGSTDGPDLLNPLGGTAPGLSVGLEKRWRRRSASMELSTSASITGPQAGRGIGGTVCEPQWDGTIAHNCHPVSSHLRDTILAPLFGSGFRGVELKIGPALVLTQTEQGPYYRHTDEDWAVVAGIDAAGRVGPHTELMATFRYAYAFRDVRTSTAMGIGSNIFRLGVGFRVILGTSPGPERR